MFLFFISIVLANKKVLKEAIPTAVPFSVPIDRMTITGPVGCSTKQCPSTPNYSQPCGK